MNIVYFTKLYKTFFNFDYYTKNEKKDEDDAIIKIEEGYILKPKEIEMQIFKINNEKYINETEINSDRGMHKIYASNNKFSWLFK